MGVINWQSFCGGDLWHNPFSTGLPNVSVCFQHTILAWIPTAFFWALLPFLFAQASLTSRRYKSLPWSLQLSLKIVNSFFLTIVSLFILFYTLFSSTAFPPSDILYPVLYSATFACITYTHYLRKQSGMVTSGILHLSAVLFAVCGGPQFYQNVRQGNDDPSYLSSALCISYLVWYAGVIIYVFVMCFADPRELSEKARGSAELNSSFINRLTLWWFNPVPWKGAHKDLEPEDLFELNEGSTSKYLSELWERHWHNRMTDYHNKMRAWSDSGKEKKPSLPSVVRCLFQMFRWEFLTASFLKIISDTLQFANPFLLHQLIGFVSDLNAPLWVGLSYSILMFVSSEVRSFVLNSYFYIMFRMGIKFQTALTAAVYKKSLELSNSARRDKTVGEIVNLMAIDIERFQMITPQIQQFWSCPYQITLALIYLFFTLGYSAIPGFIVMVIALPSNIICSIIVKRWQVEQMKLKDERTKMVNEILNGIKVVKLYAWEIPMEQHIDEIRQKELVLLRKSFLVRNVMDSFNTASPFLVALFSFGTFVLSSPSHLLTPQVAFVSLTLFNQLRSPMAMIAMLISQLVQVVVSNRRLKEYFVAEELDLSIVDRKQRTGGSAIEFEDFSATWDEGSDSQRDTNTLQDINLNAKGGSFIAVVGQVGAGKSSLLSALLGEMGRLRGTIGLHGKVAYVPQQPWIQNMTVRDNILFGKPFDRRKYNQVLSACALKHDLKMLTNGDLTEIGEKGINLSGGQKARVSLARAVYQDHDVYLLDDPLSAVDAHVGRHIFEKVLGPDGLLRNKTRILVTHRLSYIKFADEIIVLQDGRIIENGRYRELMKQRGALYKFVEEYKSSSESDENSDSETSSTDPDDGLERDMDDSEDRSDSERKTSKSAITSSLVDKSGKGKLIGKEEVETGQVKLSVYRLYLKAGTYWKCFLFFFLLAAFQVFQTLRSFWLSAWSDDYDGHHAAKMATAWRLSIYGALGTVESLCFLLSLVSLAFAGLAASYNLHAPLLHNLFRSPMSFFDTTPLGRILNRCAKDIEVVDMLLPTNVRYLAMCVLQVIVTLVVIVISTPIFAVVILPLMVIYFFFLRFYVPTSRQLKRLESTHRSPIYSQFGESIQGAASIRAFNKVEQFRAASGAIVDAFIKCKYSNIVANRWLGIRLEFIGNLVILFAALFAVISKELGWVTSPGIIGVSISYALNITEVLNFAVRQISEIEANIVAVERIDEYTNTPTEAPWEIPEKKPATGWPWLGGVNFVDYSTRYREGLDLVLRGISADVNEGEKIGIVGRTGAGKSSFALALFRLIEPSSGKILIDGVDISKIGLHDLRSNITIIPQDPVLFSGTLRFNLDPFERNTDAEIWRALELAHLKLFISSLQGGLDYSISEGGENISVGQRQLVCLARAVLRNARVLVLDEATAAVDVTTDSLIQTTIRQQFKHSTVFTIAHRLNTIMEYDRVMVLDNGRIIEFDSPQTLLMESDSAFAKMVQDSESESKRA
ncbi:Multi drug resistance-associated protein variant [Trichostrongylus colubriformis]|uniref:Multi drug resistance-associated protein variant n=1 Tax=Trichostrongylus colubriformis TaxID=6319 RepID=A0AAN8IFD7_TRICO